MKVCFSPHSYHNGGPGADFACVEQAGMTGAADTEEPISGAKGKGTAEEPFDKGNETA